MRRCRRRSRGWCCRRESAAPSKVQSSPCRSDAAAAGRRVAAQLAASDCLNATSSSPSRAERLAARLQIEVERAVEAGPQLRGIESLDAARERPAFLGTPARLAREQRACRRTRPDRARRSAGDPCAARRASRPSWDRAAGRTGRRSPRCAYGHRPSSRYLPAGLENSCGVSAVKRAASGQRSPRQSPYSSSLGPFSAVSIVPWPVDVAAGGAVRDLVVRGVDHAIRVVALEHDVERARRRDPAP